MLESEEDTEEVKDGVFRYFKRPKASPEGDVSENEQNLKNTPDCETNSNSPEQIQQTQRQSAGRSEKLRANARIHLLYEDTRRLPVVYNCQDPRNSRLGNQSNFNETASGHLSTTSAKDPHFPSLDLTSLVESDKDIFVAHYEQLQVSIKDRQDVDGLQEIPVFLRIFKRHIDRLLSVFPPTRKSLWLTRRKTICIYNHFDDEDDNDNVDEFHDMVSKEALTELQTFTELCHQRRSTGRSRKESQHRDTDRTDVDPLEAISGAKEDQHASPPSLIHLSSDETDSEAYSTAASDTESELDTAAVADECIVLEPILLPTEREARVRARQIQLDSSKRRAYSDKFSEDAVKSWSRAQLTSWLKRHSSPNAFYYRFTEPTLFQSFGEFTDEEEALWMARYQQFKERGWHVGSAWGLFSLVLPHKVGYQCSNYYRKLLKQGVVEDPSYGWDERGQFRQIYSLPEDAPSAVIPEACMIESEQRLKAIWTTPRVQRIEEAVNGYIQKYFNLIDTEYTYYRPAPRALLPRRPRTTHRKQRSTQKHRVSLHQQQPPQVVDSGEEDSRPDSRALTLSVAGTVLSSQENETSNRPRRLSRPSRLRPMQDDTPRRPMRIIASDDEEEEEEEKEEREIGRVMEMERKERMHRPVDSDDDQDPFPDHKYHHPGAVTLHSRYPTGIVQQKERRATTTTTTLLAHRDRFHKHASVGTLESAPRRLPIQRRSKARIIDIVETLSRRAAHQPFTDRPRLSPRKATAQQPALLQPWMPLYDGQRPDHRRKPSTVRRRRLREDDPDESDSRSLPLSFPLRDFVLPQQQQQQQRQPPKPLTFPRTWTVNESVPLFIDTKVSPTWPMTLLHHSITASGVDPATWQYLLLSLRQRLFQLQLFSQWKDARAERIVTNDIASTLDALIHVLQPSLTQHPTEIVRILVDAIEGFERDFSTALYARVLMHLKVVSLEWCLWVYSEGHLSFDVLTKQARRTVAFALDWMDAPWMAVWLSRLIDRLDALSSIPADAQGCASSFWSVLNDVLRDRLQEENTSLAVIEHAWASLFKLLPYYRQRRVPPCNWLLVEDLVRATVKQWVLPEEEEEEKETENAAHGHRTSGRRLFGVTMERVLDLVVVHRWSASVEVLDLCWEGLKRCRFVDEQGALFSVFLAYFQQCLPCFESEKKLVRKLSQLFVSLPRHPASAITVRTPSFMRNMASLMVFASTLSFQPPQMDFILNVFLGVVVGDFRQLEEPQCRSVCLESLATMIDHWTQQYGSWALLSAPLQLYHQFFSVLCEQFLREEPRRFEAALPAVFHVAARSHDPSRWQRQQDAVEQMIVAALKTIVRWMLRFDTLDHYALIEYQVLTSDVFALLNPNALYHARIRKHVLLLLATWHERRHQTRVRCRTEEATRTTTATVLNALPQQAASSQDSFGEFDVDYGEWMWSSQDQQRSAEPAPLYAFRQRDALFAQFLNDHVVKVLVPLMNAYFRKKGSMPGHLTSQLNDHAVYRVELHEFHRVLESLALCFVVLCENRLKEWSFYVEQYGAQSYWMNLGDRPEYRQVPVFVYAHLIDSDQFPLSMFENEVFQLWWLSNMNYQDTGQERFYAAMRRRPLGKLSFLADISVQYQFKERLDYLKEMIKILHRYPNTQVLDSRAWRKQLNGWFGQLPVIVKKCLQELERQKVKYDLYHQFSYSVMSCLIEYHSIHLYDKSDPNSLLPILLNSFFNVKPQVLSDDVFMMSLPNVLKGLVLLDIKDDPYLRRTLTQLFNIEFLSVTRDYDSQRLKQVKRFEEIVDILSKQETSYSSFLFHEWIHPYCLLFVQKPSFWPTACSAIYIVQLFVEKMHMTKDTKGENVIPLEESMVSHAMSNPLHTLHKKEMHQNDILDILRHCVPLTLCLRACESSGHRLKIVLSLFTCFIQVFTILMKHCPSDGSEINMCIELLFASVLNESHDWMMRLLKDFKCHFKSRVDITLSFGAFYSLVQRLLAGRYSCSEEELYGFAAKTIMPWINSHVGTSLFDEPPSEKSPVYSGYVASLMGQVKKPASSSPAWIEERLRVVSEITRLWKLMNDFVQFRDSTACQSIQVYLMDISHEIDTHVSNRLPSEVVVVEEDVMRKALAKVIESNKLQIFPQGQNNADIIHVKEENNVNVVIKLENENEKLNVNENDGEEIML